MSMPSDRDAAREELRRRIIGLGEGSHHKSYYPQLRQRVAELEREVAERTRIERSLRESENRYRLAQKLAGHRWCQC